MKGYRLFIDITDEFLDKKIDEILSQNNIQSICDYGCGEGGLLQRIEARHPGRFKLCGIDYFSLWPEAMRPKSSGSINLVDRNGDEFKKIGAFDLIVSTFALHHYRLPVTELQQICEFLNPNGLLFISDMHFENKTDAEATKNIDSFVDEAFAACLGKFHRHHYTIEEVLDLLKAAPLSVIDSKIQRLPLDEVQWRKDGKNSLEYFTRKRDLLSKLNQPVLEQWFRNAFSQGVEMIDRFGVDYSAVFTIIAKKTE